MSIKILYAEDEPFLSRIVSDNLIGKGYEVINAFDGRSAFNLYQSSKPDLCIIDIMMPLQDGYSLTENIRKLDHQIPIIFLSAKSLDEDVVKGFKTGGNDYLKKPFSMIELLVRIESLLNRFNNAVNHQDGSMPYQFGSCSFDAVNQQLKTATNSYDLSYKELLLLEMLLRNKNKIVERQDALLSIWGNDNIYNANSMNVFIVHLRKMLKDDDTIQIINIRGVGYKLIC